MSLHPLVRGRSCGGALDSVPSPSQSLRASLDYARGIIIGRKIGTGVQRYQNHEGKEVGLYQFCELSSSVARAACSRGCACID